MNIFSLFTALLAATALAPPTIQCRITKTEPTASTYCVRFPRRHTSATILPRVQRPRPDEVSLSSPSLTGPNTNVTKFNESTTSPLQALPPQPAWVLTLEDLVTTIFRIVITILTLFNVNITWRIRGECHRRAAHKIFTTRANKSNSQSRPSKPSIKACMGRGEVGDCLSKVFAVHAVSSWLGWIARKMQGWRMRVSCLVLWTCALI